MGLGDGEPAIEGDVHVSLNSMTEPARSHLVASLDTGDAQRGMLGLSQDGCDPTPSSRRTKTAWAVSLTMKRIAPVMARPMRGSTIGTEPDTDRPEEHGQ